MTLPFPQSVLSQHIIALGKTRAGKSSKLRLIVEQLLEREEPVCVIDPKGDWWGLKSSADGKHAGFPVVIFGGEHADVPLNAHAGAAVAELIATGNRPSLIDLGGWMVGERTRFFIDFASTFFKMTRGKRFLVIDEVHNFAPQGKVLDVDAGKMLHWANRLASEGSGKGVTIIAASQRPQKVHKDFVTSCETLIACRVIHKLDRDAIKDWIDGCADPSAGRLVLTELASMERPEAWVWSPEVNFGPKRITFPMFRTYDSFKPQEAQAAKLKGWAEVDLAEVRTKLESVVAEAEANDPAMLKKRIRDLEAQLARPQELAVDTAALEQYEEQGFQRGLKAARDAQLALLAAIRLDVDAELEAFGNTLGKLLDAKQPIEPVLTVHPSPNSMKPATRRALETVARTAAAQVSTRLKPGSDPGGNGAGVRLPVQQRILDALAELEQMGTTRPEREMLAFMANYQNVRSKGFSNACGALRSEGLIDYTGDGHVFLTDAGRAGAHPPPRPRTPKELQERIVSLLGGVSERILRPLIESYPRAIERDQLAELAGYENTRSKGFSNALGRLRSLSFIDYPERGTVVAQPVLFLERARS
jgi:hypothetical protein